jgi:ABC-type uncharacterized transport system substrate-binding protein
MTIASGQQAVGNSRKLRLASYAASAMLFALCLPTYAEQAAKIPRIGYLNDVTLSLSDARVEAFRQGLHDLGYVEGKNIVIEWRQSSLTPSENAAELVRLKVDVIVTAGGGATRPAKKATTTIPIVMMQDADPIGNGFVKSLAHPGGNITGLSRLAPELSGKQLEILKETIPKLSHVAVLGGSTLAVNRQMLREIELAAGALGLKLQYVAVRKSEDFEPAFRTAHKERADAVLWLAGGNVYIPHRKQVVELALKSKLPVIYRNGEDVEAGGLMSYGVNLNDLARRAATYVDKILKGTKPADLPVEQPTKFEFIINLKTSKQIGLAIPPNVLARADKVIK